MAIGGTLVLRLGDGLLALPLSSVVAVARMVEMALHVPRGPRHLIGLADFRGHLVPVIDLGARLGLSAPRDEMALFNGHLVVLRDSLGELALAVDEVRELGEHELLPVARALPARIRHVANAVHVGGGKLAPLLDPSSLVSVRQRAALRRIVEQQVHPEHAP